MGAGLSACNDGMRKLLMPAAGSCSNDWMGFGPPEDGSFLALGEVSMGTNSQELSGSFFKALGCRDADQSEALTVSTGHTHLVLKGAKAGKASEHSTWPGQFYVWVEDINVCLGNCRALSSSLNLAVVEDVVCCHDERYADAVVLRDPGSGNVVVVNQAPKGYAQAVRAGQGLADTKPSNVLCLMDLLCYVPQGSTASLTAFYEQLFSAKVTPTVEGCRVHFAAGESMRSTLTFKEDAAETSCRELGICFYVASEAKFRITFAKCCRAGLVACTWEEAETRGEFCVAPPEKTSVELLHRVRSPSHPNCPVRDEISKSAAMGA